MLNSMRERERKKITFGRFRQNYKLRMRKRHSTHPALSTRKAENRWPRLPEAHFQVVTGSSVTLLCHLGPFPGLSRFPNSIMHRVSLLAVAVSLLLALLLNRVDGSLAGLRRVNRLQVGLSPGFDSHRSPACCCCCCKTAERQSKATSGGQ